MSEIKVSIIIPVYNASKYLKKCLESLINQTLKDIEIICIDDGSTDNSLEILKEYEASDNRIKVFAQDNQGPAVARNLGLEKAGGEYVTFVDSDDWVDLDLCEKTYEIAIETGADATLFSHYRVSNGHIVEDDRLGMLISMANGNVFDFESNIDVVLKHAQLETVGKFYKNSFLKKNNMCFPKGLKLGEDMCFFYNFCLNSPKIAVISRAFYYYVLNTQNSLIKKPNTVKGLYRVFLYVKGRYKHSKIKDKKTFYKSFLKRVSRSVVYYWNNCYTLPYRNENFKYLYALFKQYKKILGSNGEEYKMLKEAVDEYKWKFWIKLTEPVLEIENRSTRFVIYLFENQILNIPNTKILSIYHNLFYTFNLWKLRLVSKFRKIRVGFFVTESSKWSTQDFYNELEKSKHFEPFILLSYFKKPQGSLSPKDYYNDLKKYFEQKGMRIYETFIPETFEFKKLSEFKPDIIFYQQPWLIHDEQHPEANFKRSLLCYIPYCFYSMNSRVNYLPIFHGGMWKYFVETEMHKKEYENFYGATNCVVSGSTKLDGYHFINNENAEKYWKTTGKKRIIYAPHHSFNDGIHEVATFKENGKFILELAKQHPETEWIFRPHPAFIDRVVKNSIMSVDEINEYYEEWKRIGTISEGGNYYEMFSVSDLLITDCISFLSEYAPTEKPVFHLRKDCQKEDFNDLVTEVDKTYYQIYSNEELEKLFNQVVINNEDSLKEQRKNNKKLLLTGKLASRNIYDFLKKELWL